jgi:hypothetical protein
VPAENAGMEFFCYHGDRPGSVTLRDELVEEHWSYTDRYQEQMIARGHLRRRLAHRQRAHRRLARFR